MKINSKQKRVCDFIIGQVQWWSDSNDIDSPSHMCELDNRLDDLENEGVINDNQANGLNAWLTNLLVEIRRLKD